MFRNVAESQQMSQTEKNLADRLEELFQQAIDAGRFKHKTAILEAAGLSSGFFSEMRKRIRQNGFATLNGGTAEKIAKVLRLELYQVMQATDATGADPYQSREWAIIAARALQFPEVAIQAVMSEDPGSDPGRLYWFHRIETEAERLRPASGAND